MKDDKEKLWKITEKKRKYYDSDEKECDKKTCSSK